MPELAQVVHRSGPTENRLGLEQMQLPVGLALLLRQGFDLGLRLGGQDQRRVGLRLAQ
jgi:hypothetical protein